MMSAKNQNSVARAAQQASCTDVSFALPASIARLGCDSDLASGVSNQDLQPWNPATTHESWAAIMGGNHG